ncbi:MAG: BrxA/BrxB family bacilliredoxin [Bdellovibrionales bacterium]|nr:BrxA/BrxB family bacilliredoxin [Bdellovibrionales bacterium]
MYDPNLVQPMREELTRLGVREMRTPDEVDQVLKESDEPILVIVNSVCGCAAGAARPAVALALQHGKTPPRLATVFAGQDREATERARSYFAEFPPSSPSMALLKAGHVVHMVQRSDIEGHSAQEIAQNLCAAFDQHC